LGLCLGLAQGGDGLAEGLSAGYCRAGLWAFGHLLHIAGRVIWEGHLGISLGLARGGNCRGGIWAFGHLMHIAGQQVGWIRCDGSVGIELRGAFGISLGLGQGRKFGRGIWTFPSDWLRAEMASQET
jgi:hypothetical protein